MSGLGNRFSQHSFAQIPSVQMARSQFDRSFTVKDTMEFDLLVPMFLDEILPGDTVNLNLNAFCRLATQIHPIMDNLYIDYFFFFVPNRLLWTNWEKFNGAQDDPGDSTDFTIPQIEYDSGTAGSLVGTIWDKFGLPTMAMTNNINISALPFRAYNLIYNTWFRAQDYNISLTVNTDDGPDLMAEYGLMNFSRKHDYFTSCLPWPQKGTAVDLPLGSTAPVLRSTNADGWTVYVHQTNTLDTSPAALGVNASGQLINNSSTGRRSLDPGTSGLYADLTGATAATINDLREAFQVQSILELDARGGTRYTEILLNHFGVVSPDFRLQRPEFLGSGSVRINSHVVPQTSPTSGSNAQANLAAFSTAATSGGQIGFSKSFVEHGYVLGIARARADVTYQNGVNKLWTRESRYDFFWPKLQEIGEQAVLRYELDASGSTAQQNVVLGYQERYAEYRYRPSEIHGEFRSDATASLDSWHLAIELAGPTTTIESLLESNTPIDRVIAVANSPALLCDYWFDYKHARPMMTYSVPATLGRF